MNLSDKVALVTGGAKRVGRAVAVKLAQAGCNVAITYLTSKADADETVHMIHAAGAKGWAMQVDLNDPNAAGRIRKELLKVTNRLDVLVNNASVFRKTVWGKIQREQWHEHLRLNLTAPVMITQELADILAADEGGRVINFVDIHVMGRPRRDYLAYNVSKAALLEATQSLAIELAPKVTVNAVAPGVVAWADGMTETERRDYLEHVPLQRPGTPEDAAKAVLYLARDAEYVTGQVIRLDGGRWLR